MFDCLKSAYFENCGVKLIGRMKSKPVIQMDSQYVLEEISLCESVGHLKKHQAADS